MLTRLGAHAPNGILPPLFGFRISAPCTDSCYKYSNSALPATFLEQKERFVEQKDWAV